MGQIFSHLPRGTTGLCHYRSQNTQYLFKQGQSKIRITFSYKIPSFLSVHMSKTDWRKLAARKEVPTAWGHHALRSPTWPRGKGTCRELRLWYVMWVQPVWTFWPPQTWTENTGRFCITQLTHRIVRNNKHCWLKPLHFGVVCQVTETARTQLFQAGQITDLWMRCALTATHYCLSIDIPHSFHSRMPIVFKPEAYTLSGSTVLNKYKQRSH